MSDDQLHPALSESVDEEVKKAFYTMGDVCAMFNVAPSLIRFWHSEFDEIKPHTNKKGNRIFRQQDVDTLKLIYHLLKERGFTIQGAKDYMREQRSTAQKNFEVKESLKKFRNFLVELKKELQ